jgi:RNA polymerase sigma-70 factor (ECF subfamily)
MSNNEQLLIERSKNGDVSAFEMLIEAYQKKVFNLAYRIIGNYDDANDLAQEAFIRIFRSISGFRGQSSFSTWIYRITTNVCLDEIRKRKNKSVQYLDEDIQTDDGEMQRQIISDDPLPEEIAERKELRAAINDSLGELKEEYRIIITLRDIQGMSYEEIAKVLDCPTGTVKSRINRARQALKNVLLTKRELFREEYVK